MVRTLPATDARLFADPPYPLVAAGGRVARASGSAVGPQHREDVLPAPKQGSEQGNLPGRGRRDRIAGTGEFTGRLRGRRVERLELRLKAPELALGGVPPALDRAHLLLLPCDRVLQRLPLVGGGRIRHLPDNRRRASSCAVLGAALLLDGTRGILQTPPPESGVQGRLLGAAPDETGSRCAMQAQGAKPTLPPQR